MKQEHKTIIIGAGLTGLRAGKTLKSNFLILDKDENYWTDSKKSKYRD